MPTAAVGRCYRTHKENEDKGLDED